MDYEKKLQIICSSLTLMDYSNFDCCASLRVSKPDMTHNVSCRNVMLSIRYTASALVLLFFWLFLPFREGIIVIHITVLFLLISAQKQLSLQISALSL